MFKWRYFNRIVCILSLLAVVALVVGCGTDQSPVASSEEGTGLVPATKRIKSNGLNQTVANTVATTYAEDVRTATAVFGPEGGNFSVLDENGGGKKDDLEVALMIPPGILDQEVEITMTVHGEDFNFLLVEFQPAGLVFSTSVDLRIDLGRDLATNKDVNSIVPYHLYSDGTTGDVEVYFIDRSSNAFNIYLKVPGFSRYGLRD